MVMRDVVVDHFEPPHLSIITQVLLSAESMKIK